MRIPVMSVQLRQVLGTQSFHVLAIGRRFVHSLEFTHRSKLRDCNRVRWNLKQFSADSRRLARIKRSLYIYEFDAVCLVDEREGESSASH